MPEDYITQIEDEILDQYVNDDNPRPWIVAFSGGKDSTMLLQLVWSALQRLQQDERRRKIYIVCNNTLVENPTILTYVEKQLDLIRTAAIEASMPIEVTHTIPKLNDTFWVNLIGRGYPAPNTKFRWCTERLKIKPTTKFIQNKVSLYGEVIILLGTRKDESNTRARSIKRHEVRGKRLSKHDLPGAYVYAPLKEISTQHVWEYLIENQSPWHSDNLELVHIYRNASDNNDCPLIMDKSTPPCGQSRFGCWVCTLVTTDKSMLGLIERGGETWMKPLIKIRDLLAKTINRDDPEYKPEKYRMPVRRNFSEGLGPYWPKYRRKILKHLLEAQYEIQEERPHIQLITQQELIAIQILWHRDFIYDHDVVGTIKKIYGQTNGLGDIDEKIEEEKALLAKTCKRNKKDFELITNLLQAQRNRIIFTNKRGALKDIENVLEEHLYPTFTDVYK